VIVDTGVGSYLGKMLMTSAISPLVVVWLISLCMRLAQGSATVAIITAAGIAAPLVKNLPGYTPNELVLALCCGGSAFSHMSDSGFWIVSQYYGLSVPQCLKSWTAMKTVAAVLGLGIILAVHALIK
jgi:H+/gluconate symporter-like permease